MAVGKLITAPTTHFSKDTQTLPALLTYKALDMQSATLYCSRFGS